MTQMQKVSATYGAPMGRSESGYLETRIKRFVRLYRVRIDSGGYDDGGAYWGIGAPLYCAEDDDGNRKFVRARSRLLACVKLDIPIGALKVKPAFATMQGFITRYLDTSELLKLHEVKQDDFIEWCKWSGVAMGQDRAEYSLAEHRGN